MYITLLSLHHVQCKKNMGNEKRRISPKHVGQMKECNPHPWPVCLQLLHDGRCLVLFFFSVTCVSLVAKMPTSVDATTSTCAKQSQSQLFDPSLPLW